MPKKPDRFLAPAAEFQRNVNLGQKVVESHRVPSLVGYRSRIRAVMSFRAGVLVVPVVPVDPPM
jgi:hypothetical protein